MGNEIRFPTILGLGVLLIGLTVGIFMVSQRQIFSSRASQSAQPKNLAVANITADSAAVYWLTDVPANGFVQLGIQSTGLGLTFKDDRDFDNPKEHTVHFVTLTNLSPNTNYYFKVNSGGASFPEQAVQFKTGPELNNQNLAPIIGTVLDTNLQPIGESLAVLEINGAQTLAAISKASGNYVIPLAQIRTSQLDQNFLLNKPAVDAKLTLSGANKSSVVNFRLPLTNPILPPVTLGQDQDLTNLPTASSSATIIPDNKYDLNLDGVVNSLDLSIVINDAAKNPKDHRADFNNDGVVDQKDVDLMIRTMQQ